MKTIFTILFVSILALAFPTHISAQYGMSNQDGSKTSIGINPSISEIVIEDSTPIIKTVTVSNLSNSKIPIKVYVEGLSLSDKKSIPENLLKRYDASSWFKIKDIDKDFILEPNARRDISVEITKPSDASVGGNYVSMIFQSQIPKELSVNSISIYSKLSSVFLLQVKGDINESVKFDDLKISTWINTPSIDYDLTILNTGNIHTRPLTKILVKEIITNKDYSSESIVPSLILPGLKGEYIGTINNLPSLGIVKLSVSSTFGANNSPIESQDRYVLIFPYWIVITLVLFLLLLSFLMRKKYRERIKLAFRIIINKEKKAK